MAKYCLTFTLVTVVTLHITFFAECQEQLSSSLATPTLAPLSDLTLIGTISGRTFYVQNVMFDWTQSKNLCAKYGLDLASIETKEEHTLVNQWAAQNGKKYYVVWLAGRITSSSQLEWSTSGKRVPSKGEFPTNFEDWASSTQPSVSSSSGTCLAVKLDFDVSGTWSAFGCERSFRPMCVHDQGKCATTTQPAHTTDLPESYPPFTGRMSMTGKVFYAYEAIRWTPLEAEVFCARRGQAVASIETDEEWTFVKQWLSDKGPKAYWIQPDGSSTYNCVFAHGKFYPHYPKQNSYTVSCATEGGHPMCMDPHGQ